MPLSDEALNWNPFGNAEPFPGETLVGDGWTYRDFRKMPIAEWEALKAAIGAEHVRFITDSRYEEDSVLGRGQIFVSPTGADNLRKFEEAQNSAI